MTSPRPWKLVTEVDQTTLTATHESYTLRDANNNEIVSFGCTCDDCVDEDGVPFHTGHYEDPKLIQEAVNAYGETEKLVDEVEALKEKLKGAEAKLEEAAKHAEDNERENERFETAANAAQEEVHYAVRDVGTLIRWALRAGADQFDVRPRLHSQATGELLQKIALDPSVTW